MRNDSACPNNASTAHLAALQHNDSYADPSIGFDLAAFFARWKNPCERIVVASAWVVMSYQAGPG